MLVFHAQMSSHECAESLLRAEVVNRHPIEIFGDKVHQDGVVVRKKLVRQREHDSSFRGLHTLVILVPFDQWVLSSDHSDDLLGIRVLV